jgi:hypothetical protein
MQATLQRHLLVKLDVNAAANSGTADVASATLLAGYLGIA